MKLTNVNIVLEDKVIFGDIKFNGKITKIIEKDSFKEGFPLLTPGFIDTHIHGSASFDAMDASENAIEQMALSLVREGTTSFMPTPMTQSNDKIIKSLESIASYYKNQNPLAAEVIGIHLEGPYFNVAARGAQPQEFIRNPNIEEFNNYLKASDNLIKKLSLAPELPGATELIKHLVSKNIIPSLAHTKATYNQALAAYQAGATSLTHTYNAMSPIHHRDIGVVGLGYTEEVMCELIYDTIHVSPPAAKLLINNATVNRVMLITDAMRNKWLPDGISELGGQTVIIKNGEARLENGSLAGSILKMIDGYNNLRKLGYNYVELAKLTSTNAAKHFKLNDRGIIKERLRSDFVLLDENHQIISTFIQGIVVYQK
ncbi:MAG: N-acetylglucosamine-6-phosphate deacetylase [Acholeplasmataceae bacterium]